MSATSAVPGRKWYHNVVPLSVTSTEIRECGRIFASYGDGREWGPQPEEVAYLRANMTRPRYGLPRRVLLMLLFNGRAQRLADYVNAKRREKLGASKAKDIPSLIVDETAAESEANVLEARVLAGQADRTVQAELGEKLRTQAFKALALADALADAVHGSEATV